MRSSGRALMLVWSLLAVVLAATAIPAVAAPQVLSTANFRRYVETFNTNDNDLYHNNIDNAAAWTFLRKNAPVLECPDRDFEEIFAFRFWTFRKHLKKTTAGWVVTEFLPKVGWSRKFNTINCAAGAPSLRRSLAPRPEIPGRLFGLLVPQRRRSASV